MFELSATDALLICLERRQPGALEWGGLGGWGSRHGPRASVTAAQLSPTSSLVGKPKTQNEEGRALLKYGMLH